MKARIYLILLVIFLGACVSYAAVSPGEQVYGGLKVNSTQAWNLAPREAVPGSRPNARVWTQDGILLDRILTIPAVADGETLFRQESSEQALPVYRADMLPNEIEELTESSIAKMFGEGQVSVETAGLRPHQYGDQNGFVFDMNVTVSDGPNYRGVAGAFTAEQSLYLIIYLGAEPHYFEKHLDEALVIIKGARI